MSDPSVLVCCNSAEGHARPMVAVADAFVRHGWRVRTTRSGRSARGADGLVEDIEAIAGLGITGPR